LESYRNLSSFHLVIDPTLFYGDDVYTTAQSMFDELRAQAPAPGYDDVKLPGQIEADTMRRSLKEGITIPASIIEYLKGEK
jgi:ureidoglycolate dehydrogenase (NAD+)